MINFYRCKTCGKVITIIEPGNEITVCCGEPMEQIPVKKPGDPGFQMHLVKIKKKFGCYELSVGTPDPHAQTYNHYIKWLAVEYDKGVIIKQFKPLDEVKMCLKCSGCVKPKAVYVMCNLDGLWKTNVEE